VIIEAVIHQMMERSVKTKTFLFCTHPKAQKQKQKTKVNMN